MIFAEEVASAIQGTLCLINCFLWHTGDTRPGTQSGERSWIVGKWLWGLILECLDTELMGPAPFAQREGLCLSLYFMGQKFLRSCGGTVNSHGARDSRGRQYLKQLGPPSRPSGREKPVYLLDRTAFSHLPSVENGMVPSLECRPTLLA